MKLKRQSNLFVPSVVTGACTAAGMLVYEATKQWLFPGITLWESHFMTTVVATGGAVIAVRRALRSQANLQRDAYFDRLTGFLNRNGFVDAVERMRRRSRFDSAFEFAVLYLDTDRFKGINDALGHQGGDRLIHAIAQRLSAHLRPLDLLARIGGDEFAILLGGIGDADVASDIANRIRDAMLEPFVIAGREVRASLSVGSVVCDVTHESAEEILRDADLAMYRAKALGGNRAEPFLPMMRLARVRRVQLEGELFRAAERGEIWLAYQPIVSLLTGDLVGVEALMRWTHPLHGNIPPTEFIAIAEESDLINRLGDFALAEACREIGALMAEMPEVKLSLSVNMSPRQLRHDLARQTVARTLRETGFPAALLNLEITENVLAHEDAETALRDLAATGVTIHLDDFGAGHSSLTYLTKYPIAKLKIDRYFIHRLGRASNSADIVRTIVDLAAAMQIGVVAEGVENAEHEQILRELGCPFAQGYHYSHPLNLDELRDLVRGRNGADARGPSGARTTENAA